MLAAGMVLASAGVTQAQTTAQLTEQEVARLTADNPGWMGATDARRAATEARARAAGARPNLEFEVTREGGDGLSGVGTEDAARVRYPLDLGGVRSAQRGAGLARRDAELAGLQSTLAARVALARRLFVEAVAMGRRGAVRRSLADRLTGLASVVRRRLEDGDAAELELHRVEAEADAAHALALRYEAESGAKWAELQGYIGQAPGSYVLPGGLRPEPLKPLDDYMARLSDGPEPRRLAAELRAAEVEADAIRRQARVPQTSVIGGLRSTQDTMGRSTGVIVGAALSMPFGGGLGAQAQARAAEAQALRVELRLWEETRRNTLLTSWSAAERMARILEVPPAPAAQILTPAEAAYEAGEIDLSELLSAHRTAVDAALARIELEQEAALARVRLDELVGKTAP